MGWIDTHCAVHFGQQEESKDSIFKTADGTGNEGAKRDKPESQR